jgi:uncharacterized protein with von Willebrand factor type A (vWA) domain
VDAAWWTLLGVVVGAALATVGSLAVATKQIHAASTAQKAEWQEKAAAQTREWREAAYVSALAALNRQRQVIQRSWPFFGPAEEPPPKLPDGIVELAEARLSSHSSLDMRSLLDRWVERRAEFYSQGARIDFERAHPEAVSTGSDSAWEKLGKARAELIGDKPEGGIIGEIAAQIRTELGYKD